MRISVLTLRSRDEANSEPLLENSFKMFEKTKEFKASHAEFKSFESFFVGLSNAIKTESILVLAVTPSLYISCKERLFKAMNLQSTVSPQIITQSYNSEKRVDKEELRRHAIIPNRAVPMLTHDGLYSGFIMEGAGQYIVYMPYEEDATLDVMPNLYTFLGKVLPDKRTVVDESIEIAEEKATTQTLETLKAGDQETLIIEELEAKASEKQTDNKAPLQPSFRLMTAAGDALFALQEAYAKLALRTPDSEDLFERVLSSVAASNDEILFDTTTTVPDDVSLNHYAAKLARQTYKNNEVQYAASLVLNTNAEKGEEEAFISLCDSEGAVVQRVAFPQGQLQKDAVMDRVASLLFTMLAQELSDGSVLSKGRKTRINAGVAPVAVPASLQTEKDAQEPPIDNEEKLVSEPVLPQAPSVKEVEESDSEDDWDEDSEEQAPMKKRTRNLMIIISIVIIILAGVATYFLITDTGREVLGLAPRDRADGVTTSMVETETSIDNRGGVGLISETGETTETTTETTTQITTTETTTLAENEQNNANAVLPGVAGQNIATPAKVTNGEFRFTVYGFGHGVGMSQFGANGYAKQGWGHERILTHYYSKTTVTTISKPVQKLTLNGQEVAAKEAVARVLEAEMGASFHNEALKAQAIAIYTYATFNGRNTCAGMSAGASVNPKMLAIVNEVWGKVVHYGGKPINAVFCSYNAGYTASSAGVWNSPYPYLVPVESVHDKALSNFQTTASFSAETMKKRVQDTYGIALTGNPSTWFIFEEHDSAVSKSIGYVSSVLIGNQKRITGTQFRENLMDYDIRSHCFEMKYIAE